MSGYKRATISISEDEYHRLREAEHKLRELPEASRESQNRIVQESQAYFQASIHEMERRQSSLQQVVSGMSEYVRELERNTSQALIAFESSAMTDMENYTGSLWRYFDQLVSNHARQFEEVITSNHRQYQQELGILARRIRRLAENQDQKQLIAEEWLSAAEQLADFIRENYACPFFLPGRMETIEKQLDQVHQNLGFGLSEAVIASSQQLYLSLSDIRIELERLQAEWQMVYSSVREAVDQEIQLLEQSRAVQAFDLDGNPLDYLVNVEYWTGDRLPQLSDELMTLRAHLEDTLALPDTQTLARWLTEGLPGYHHALEDIVLDARVAALNSQLRINIADLVVRALREQGFALSNADYEASDMRLGYGMQLTNIEGNEVIVQVEPVGTAVGDNELQISSLDSEQRTEHELVRQWDEISRSLAMYGLEIGPYGRDGAPVPQRSVQHAPPVMERLRRNLRPG